MHEEALRDVEFGVRVWGWVSCRLLGSISSHHRIRLTMQALKVPGMVAGHRAVQQLRIMDTDVSALNGGMHAASPWPALLAF